MEGARLNPGGLNPCKLAGPRSLENIYCNSIAAIPHIARYILGIPPFVFSFAQALLCDTPFCNASRDNCAIPHKNKPEKNFAILSLQVSRDMKKYHCWASKCSWTT